MKVISHQVIFSVLSPSAMVSQLVPLGNLLHEGHGLIMMLLRLLTKPANNLSIILTEEQEFVSMKFTEITLFLLISAQFYIPESLYYVSQIPVMLEVPKPVSYLAHRISVLPFLFTRGLLVLHSDADMAEAVATVYLRCSSEAPG